MTGFHGGKFGGVRGSSVLEKCVRLVKYTFEDARTRDQYRGYGQDHR